jgi:hypothetical protein
MELFDEKTDLKHFCHYFLKLHSKEHYSFKKTSAIE